MFGLTGCLRKHLKGCRKEIFNRTGIAFQNSIPSTAAVHAAEQPDVLERASTMLFIPDLLTYFLTGEKRTEFKATTSQMLDAATGQWSRELLKALGIPEHFLTK